MALSPFYLSSILVSVDGRESAEPESGQLEQSFAAITLSLSTFNASCEHALRIGSLSFEQVEQVALSTANTLAALNRYRNKLLPVSKLPPELLNRIFEFAVAPPTVNIYQPKPSEPTNSAVNIARVCSSWRAIALASSQLWYHIVDNNVGWPSQPKMFLHRSRFSDIHVYTSLPDALRNTHSVWRKIIPRHARRVRELHLFVDNVIPIEYLLTCTFSLPVLEFLTLTAGGEGFFAQALLPHLPLIFGVLASNVKAMALGPNVPFFPGNSFPNLINLQLRGISRSVASTGRLLDLLSNTPRLETFELLSPSHDLDLDTQTANHPPVALKHLKVFWISSVASTPAFSLLSKLELPAVSTVRLTELYAKSDQSPPVPRSVLPLSHMGLTDLDILEGGKPAGRDTPFNLHFLAHGARAGTDTGLWVNFRFWRPHICSSRQLKEQYSHEEYVFWSVFTTLPTLGVTALRLSTLSPAHLRRAALIVGGERVPALESLVVRSQKSGSATENSAAVDRLARILAPFESEPGCGDAGQAVPRLGSLTIELNRAWKRGMGDVLVRTLEGRKLSGHPLRSVACSALSVGDPELAGRIKEHVVGDVRVTDRKLWERKEIPEVWMVKNDYWRLYPASLARTGNGWGLPENT
ncbi:hypothetical protein LXA43DRAFT_1011957 [Ganoderma leucocontextum]|nr:hypothetical protein LXA43DRAFT_1011957 [Ganoderma leucocontextum]